MGKETSPHFLETIFSILESAHPCMSEEQVMVASMSLGEALLGQTPLEIESSQIKRYQKFNLLLNDHMGKAFFHAVSDQCFRSSSSSRSMDQYAYLLSLYDLPESLSGMERIKFSSINSLYKKMPSYAKKALYKYLITHARPFFLDPAILEKKQKEPAPPFNVDCYCSPPLCKEDIQKHIEYYTYFAKNDKVNALTINIENLIIDSPSFCFKRQLKQLTKHIRTILMVHLQTHTATCTQFFLEANLYIYDALLLEAFLTLLEDEALRPLELGIVLHSYYPDSFSSAKLVLEAAKAKHASGGAKTIVTLSKGKFLKKEAQLASSLGCAQPCFLKKELTDANFKKILKLLISNTSIHHTHVHVFTHNLLDIAYSLILKAKEEIDEGLFFEMVQNLSQPLAKALSHIGKQVIEKKTYVPKSYEKQAIITLYRKISDQSNPYSFICTTRETDREGAQWKRQLKRFESSFALMHKVPEEPRFLSAKTPKAMDRFIHEPPLWATHPEHQGLIENALKKPQYEEVKLTYLKDVELTKQAKPDPHHLSKTLYHVEFPELESFEKLLKVMRVDKEGFLKNVEALKEKIAKAATLLKEQKQALIAHQVHDIAMPFHLASDQVRALIDYANLAISLLPSLLRHQDMHFAPIGNVVICPHPFMPLSTAAQAIFSALACGNSVIVTASIDTFYVLYTFIKTLWQAGFGDDQVMLLPAGTEAMVKLAQIDSVDSMHYFGMREEGLKLARERKSRLFHGEFEGKNSTIITAMSDKSLAIKHAIHSAFCFSGKHPFSTSLLILEKEVFQDPRFKDHLKQTVQSLHVGPAYDPSCMITPLVQNPNSLEEKMLQDLESDLWLVKPKRLNEESNLYSPGVIWGIARGDFFHLNPLNIPILAVMEADNLDEAIYLANNTPFGLSQCLESLDSREHKQWLGNIKTGSRFINISSTHLMVKKNPISAIKHSSLGASVSRGGPNSLIPYLYIQQVGIPKEKYPVDQRVNNLTRLLEQISLSAEDLGIWYASISSYAFFYQQFKRERDLVKITGEDHTLLYRPMKKILFRIKKVDNPLDFLRIFAAGLTAHIPMEVSWEKMPLFEDKQIDWQSLLPGYKLYEEEQTSFLKKLQQGSSQMVRMIGEPTNEEKQLAAISGTQIESGTPFSNGRFELMLYFHEIVTSSTYHRFGNLGLREGEIRYPNY